MRLRTGTAPGRSSSFSSRSFVPKTVAPLPATRSWCATIKIRPLVPLAAATTSNFAPTSSLRRLRARRRAIATPKAKIRRGVGLVRRSSVRGPSTRRRTNLSMGLLLISGATGLLALAESAQARQESTSVPNFKSASAHGTKIDTTTNIGQHAISAWISVHTVASPSNSERPPSRYSWSP